MPLDPMRHCSVTISGDKNQRFGSEFRQLCEFRVGMCCAKDRGAGMKNRVAVSIVFIASLQGTVGLAQTIPPNASPSRIEDRFKAPSVSKSQPDIAISPQDTILPSEADSKIRFTLKGVVVSGSTVFKPGDLSSAYQSLVGKEISLADLYHVRDEITAKYRRSGYLLSRAIIPPQKIADGVAQIQVVEGYIAKVTVEKDVRDRRHLVEAMARHITQSHPLKASDLERYILLISDIPGIHVRTVIKP